MRGNETLAGSWGFVWELGKEEGESKGNRNTYHVQRHAPQKIADLEYMLAAWYRRLAYKPLSEQKVVQELLAGDFEPHKRCSRQGVLLDRREHE
jgi:hypothetical protein